MSTTNAPLILIACSNLLIKMSLKPIKNKSMRLRVKIVKMSKMMRSDTVTTNALTTRIKDLVGSCTIASTLFTIKTTNQRKYRKESVASKSKE